MPKAKVSPTADDKALDRDVILAAQATIISNQGEGIVIATTNVSHLTRFIQETSCKSQKIINVILSGTQ